MGEHDAPAQINYVRDKTGVDQVTYIGHSQGTSQMFYGLAENQDYWKDKLNLYVALAPVTRLDHSKSELMVFFSQFQHLISAVANVLQVWQILGGPANTAAKLICT